MKIDEAKASQKARRKAETIPKKTKIGGVELTPEQWQILKKGGFLYLENMKNSEGQILSAYVFTDDKLEKVFISKQQPDSFVKYGKYEMRIQDKILIEKGYVIKAKVKWWGGSYAYPYLWKENKSDAEYKESWKDPRIKKEERAETKKQNQQPIIKKSGPKLR